MMEYLTEEELNALIQEVEMTEMTTAPPDLLDDILQKIDSLDDLKNDLQDETETKEQISELAKPPRIVCIEKRRKEYRRFCIQVVSSVAAAIALIFMLPGLSGGKEMSVPAKEQVLAASDVKPKEEVLKRSDNKLMSKIGNSRYLESLRLDGNEKDIFLEDGIKNHIFNWRTNQ